METPKNGYGFKHKTTGDISLALSLGTSDSLDNYEEITQGEYQAVLDEQLKRVDIKHKNV